MKRVVVIGSPGAGKSTFATELARLTGLPLIHLDQQFWNPGWVETEKQAWHARVAGMVAGDTWIIDGNYSGSLALRLARADTVIQLDIQAWTCVIRVLRRVSRGGGQPRADMAEGCPEHFNLPFLWYILTFPLTSARRVERKLDAFHGQLVRLSSDRQVRDFLASLRERG